MCDPIRGIFSRQHVTSLTKTNKNTQQKVMYVSAKSRWAIGASTDFNSVLAGELTAIATQVANSEYKNATT